MNGGGQVAKVCGVCGRFRLYQAEDQYCIVCGYDHLAAECECGRSFDYAIHENDTAPLHCPRCGKDWRGSRNAT